MGGGGPVGPAAWQKWNVNELTDLENVDEISGFPVYKSLLCEVVQSSRPGVRRPRRTRLTADTESEADSPRQVRVVKPAKSRRQHLPRQQRHDAGARRRFGRRCSPTWSDHGTATRRASTVSVAMPARRSRQRAARWPA